MNFFNNIEFEHPWLLLLLAIIPALLWFLKKKKSIVRLPLPDIQTLKMEKKSLKLILSGILPYLNIIALAFFIIALGGPRLSLKEEKIDAEGIDIMLALDVSTSMLSEDLKPNRLEASKSVAKEFISKRPYDRIGIVIFSGEAFTLIPATTDHELLDRYIDQLQAGVLKDGTAIGNGLAAAVNRLKDSDAKSKIIILLTDGMNNSGYVDPSVATDMAKEYNIKVYTIGVGTNGMAKSPVSSAFGQIMYAMVQVEIDEALLKNISNETNGVYYRATDNEELKKIYDNIDKLEKTKIEVKVYRRYSEEFRKFVIIAALLLLLTFILENTILRKIP